MNNLPKTFDLLKVEYRHGAGRCLAYAPCSVVMIGDYVETTFGVGKVTDKTHYHTPDEAIIRVLDDVVTIDKVLWKLTPINWGDSFEEAEDAEHTGRTVDD